MIIPIPPMTNLLSASMFSHDCSRNEDHPTVIPICRITAVRQAQVYGVLHYSPQLKHLFLCSTIDDLKSTRLLAAAISRMSNLHTLHVLNVAFEWPESKLVPTIVACCPPSLITLDIRYRSWDEGCDSKELKTEEDWEAAVEAVKHFMPLLGEENGVPIVPRQGSLDRLSHLHTSQLETLTLEEVLSVFKQCPNITNIFNLELGGHIDPMDVAKCIIEHCPKVNRLTHHHVLVDFQLIMNILSILPTDTLQAFVCCVPDKSSANLASRLLRHSASLREIHLRKYQDFSSKAFQSILVHCQALETFSCEGHGPVHTIKFNLADVTEIPWGATRLKHLRLMIAMDYVEPTGEGPLYQRLSQTNLSAADYNQMVMLKKLYHQIGRLIDLETLNMRLFDPLRPGYYTKDDEISFPGMLSLPREDSNRLGYLHLLAGLKKLRTLHRVIIARHDETIKMVEQPEVEWIAQNWPSLEEITFFRSPEPGQSKPQPRPSCFLWLQDQMPRLKMHVPGTY
ncbi:hypothetical protein BGZ70_001028 [Mortierella alpina]|uniref:Uncharacterized protein n=1 Tax=Mortierella alpina TaxID=64518 RepID=A0A9P6IWN5_MORAP|nr:hypothetical protein BGZ70_001028 [Mortierella alpina]